MALVMVAVALVDVWRVRVGNWLTCLCGQVVAVAMSCRSGLRSGWIRCGRDGVGKVAVSGQTL